jgi:two-component system, LytTR family, response regulator
VTGPAPARAGQTRVRVLVVDDEPLARAHLCALLAARDDVEVVGECGDGRSAVERIDADAPDVVLLDIHMPELSGLEVVREIGADRMPTVVFVTAHDDHALEAFEAQALDYIVKPVERERLAAAMDRAARAARREARADGAPPADAQAPALQRLLAEAPAARPDRIAIRIDGRVLLVRPADIDWIEAADDSVRFHVGRTVYEQRDTLSRLEQRLPAGQFLRIHRSTIVNLDRIRELQPWFQGDWVVILVDGTKLTTGRSYRPRLKALIDGTA